MPFYVSHKPKAYPPPPEGLQSAVCCDVVDLGTIDGQYGPKPKLRLVWQLEDIEPGSDPARRFTVVGQYTVSLHEKSRLRKDLETWRGRAFTKEELDQFDLEKLIGVPCQLQVVHSQADDGRIFGNVQAVVGLGKGMSPLHVEGYVRKKDRDAMKDAAHSPDATATSNTYDDHVPF